MKKLFALMLVLVLTLGVALNAGAAGMLQQGMRGESVRKLQQALVDQGWADLKIDGIYGPATAAAVQYYQKMNGLQATGRAGSTTLTNLVGSAEVDVNPDGSGTLALGSSGITVRNVQTRLKALGYPVGSVDGKYGKKTQAAVAAFQTCNGLTADGKVGAKTMAALNDSSAVAYYTTHTYAKLKRGDSGKDVTKLQQTLAGLGFYTGAITGYYSYATFAAVQDFQMTNGLKVDGIAGQQTLSALYGK
ncbi:MAG: peptidoglycan-binding protein [Clostridia bacterium]|nr:peptidoglycan-binding protein [Clostridia bacterium]